MVHLRTNVGRFFLRISILTLFFVISNLVFHILPAQADNYNYGPWVEQLTSAGKKLSPRHVYQVYNHPAFDPTQELTNYSCRDQTAFVEVTWYSEQETAGNGQRFDPINPPGPPFGFKETYPIQDGWKLKFNTPDYIKEGEIKQVSFSDDAIDPNEDAYCEHLVIADDIGPMELWSGFKKTNDKDDVGETFNEAKFQYDNFEGGLSHHFTVEHPMNGHFAITKEFYAAVPNDETVLIAELNKHQYSVNTESDLNYTYFPLGSVTALGGSTFPALKGGLFGELTIEPHAIRNPHWHFEYAEAGFCYQGLGQVGVIVPKNTIPVFPPINGIPFVTDNITEEIFIKPNEIFLFPQGSQHYLRNIGNEVFKCMLFFPKGLPLNPLALLTINLNDIVNNTPLKVTGTMFNTDVNGETDRKFTAKNIAAAAEKSIVSDQQGPQPILLVESCLGNKPSVNYPVCEFQTNDWETYLENKN